MLYLAWGLEWVRVEDTKGKESVEEACAPILTSETCAEAVVTRDSVADRGFPLPHYVPLAQVRRPGAVATTCEHVQSLGVTRWASPYLSVPVRGGPYLYSLPSESQVNPP